MNGDYLVAVTKGEDRYVLADSAGKLLVFIGTEYQFLDDEHMRSILTENDFRFAAEYGATDKRMYWENSTYIEFTSGVITRRTLVEFIDDLDTHLDESKIPSTLYIPHMPSVKPGIPYADFCFGAETHGILRPEVDAFINELRGGELDPHIAPRTLTHVSGKSLFSVARMFAKESGGIDNKNVLGWAVATAHILSKTGLAFANQVEENPAIAKERFGAFLGLQWEQAYRLSRAFDQSVEYSMYINIVTKCPMDEVIDLIEAGFTKPREILSLLDNGIDIETAKAANSLATDVRTHSHHIG